MAQFETACQEFGVHLFLLPPRSPKLNGHVQRAQRTHREEFYEVVDLPDPCTTSTRCSRHGSKPSIDIGHTSALGYLTPAAWLEAFGRVAA